MRRNADSIIYQIKKYTKDPAEALGEQKDYLSIKNDMNPYKNGTQVHEWHHINNVIPQGQKCSERHFDDAAKRFLSVFPQGGFGSFSYYMKIPNIPLCQKCTEIHFDDDCEEVFICLSSQRFWQFFLLYQNSKHSALLEMY